MAEEEAARGFKYADARIAPQLLCGLCKEPLCAPAELSCHHYFCEACLAAHVRNAHADAKSDDEEEGAQVGEEPPLACPVCDRAATSGEVRVLESDHVIVGLLADLHVHCPRHERGCRAVIARSAVDSHIAHACSFSPCSGEPDGCDFLGTAAEVAAHERNECKFVLLPCAYAREGCAVVVRRGGKRAHEQQCEAHAAYLAERERQRLEPQRLQRRAAREARVRALYAAGQQRVVRNVGGRRFTLATATVEEHMDSLLFDLVQVAVEDEANADNEVFLDRDPDALAGVVAWLRTGELPRGCDRRVLLREAQFLQLGALARRLAGKGDDGEGEEKGQALPMYSRDEFIWALALLRAAAGEAPVTLSGVCLRGLDLSHVDMSNCLLRRADLTGVDLTGANLWKTDLTGATLKRATLTDADLTNTRLGGANVTGAVGYRYRK